MTGLGTPQANLLIPDLVAYSGPINFAAETGNVTVTAATLAAAGGSSSGGYGAANGMVFDAITVGAPGAFAAHDAGTITTSSPAAADSPAPLAAPVDAAPNTGVGDASGAGSATVQTSGATATLTNALLGSGAGNVASSYYPGATAGVGLTTSTPSGAYQSAGTSRHHAFEGLAGDALFIRGDFQTPAWQSLAPADGASNAPTFAKHPTGIAAGPVAVDKASPTAPLFPCDIVFMASKDGAPVSHAAVAMLDKANSVGGVALSAAALTFLFSGVRDDRAAWDEKRRRQAWQA